MRARSQLPVNLPQLQNLIKRDSESYKEEVIAVLAGCIDETRFNSVRALLCVVQFQMQHRHYQALLQLFLANPSQESKSLEELVMFLSQVILCTRTCTS